MARIRIPTVSCIGMPTTKIFIWGIVRANIPNPTLVSKIANVTGIAIFMPVKTIPVVKRAIISGKDRSGLAPSNGTSLKLSKRADIIM